MGHISIYTHLRFIPTPWWSPFGYLAPQAGFLARLCDCGNLQYIVRRERASNHAASVQGRSGYR